MWPYLERELRVAARSWDALASVLLIASALGFIFAESYAAGLAAVNFVTVALYAYTQILREEELGTLDGLRLLRQPEKLVAAKFIVLFVTSLATSAVYSAVYFATSLSRLSYGWRRQLRRTSPPPPPPQPSSPRRLSPACPSP